MSESSEDVQQASQQLQLIQAQLEELTREREAIRTTLENLRGAMDALERLDSGSTVQVPLGGSAYVRAEIQEIDEVIVDIGAGYSAQRSQDGALSTLDERETILEDRLETVTERIGELESEGSELERQLQQVIQAQQAGGGPGSGLEDI